MKPRNDFVYDEWHENDCHFRIMYVWLDNTYQAIKQINKDGQWQPV